MLNSFRALGNSLFAKLLLGFLVLTFVIWGIESRTTLHHQMTVATVGGTTINGEDYTRALHRETENLRRMLGESATPETLRSLGLPQQVLQKLINMRLIRLESAALGIIPSDSDVARRIRSDMLFQDDKGNFEKKRFENALGHLGMSERKYVDQLRDDMAANLLLDTLSAHPPLPDIAVRTLVEAQQEQRSATLYTLTPSLVNVPATPEAAQLEAYYNEHKSDFTLPEYRTISYVTLTAADATNGAAISDEQLRQAYQDRIADFRHPERRTVEQLLFNTKEEADKATDLLKKGESFAQVAKATDPSNKDNLSLGKIERSGVPEKAADAVFSLKQDEYTAPVQTDFGWHIFHVTAIEPPSTDSFEQARPALEKEVKQEGGDDALNKLANNVQDELAGGATLAEAANKFKLKMHAIPSVDSKGMGPDGQKVKEVPDFDKFLDTAFKTEEKTESQMITAKGGFYILRIDAVTPERARPLEDVKAKVIAGWQHSEREKRLADLAKELTGKFTDAQTRTALIAKYNLAPLSATLSRDSKNAGSQPLPPELVGDIFARKPQDSTGAYPASNGNYVIAVVGNILPPAPDKDAKSKEKLESVRQQLQRGVQSEMLEQYLHYLAGKYKVSIDETVLDTLSR